MASPGAIVDHFQSNEIHAIIHTDEFRQWMLQFLKAGIGKEATKQINEGVRSDRIQWIDPPLFTSTQTIPGGVFSRFDSLCKSGSFSLASKMPRSMTSYPVIVCIIVTFYKRHLDQFRADGHRKLSVICYLNEHWTGADGGQPGVISSGGRSRCAAWKPVDWFASAVIAIEHGCCQLTDV